MPKMRFEVQAANRALEANFRGAGSAAQRAVQAVNRRRGPAHYQRVHDATPEVSGRMRRLLRFEPTPNDFGYRLGWAPEDFIAEDQYPYYRVVLYGSRTVLGDDFFDPILRDEQRAYRAEIQAELRREMRGRAR